MSPASNFAAPRPGPGPGDLRIGPEPAQRRLVLLHGWGADADDLLELGLELVDGGESVDVVALRAPGLHPAGAGREWYPLAPAPDWAALPAARQGLRERLEQLARNLPLDRTVLLGFSQGGAMAVDVATSAAGLPLAGLISCSGYPHPDWQPRATALPVLLTHGSLDQVVPAEACSALEDALRAGGAQVTRQLFEGGHGIDPQLFPLMRQFLERAWSVPS
ncbi:MAG: alpha/beta hydrolase [Synechococcaceae cyanobacterium]|jgi:phospholipase/carboxylesterase